MPCRSDYLEQTPKEYRLQRTALLLDYTLVKLVETRRTQTPVNKPLSTSTSDLLRKASGPAAREYYASDLGQVEALCALLTEMSESERDAIVYNGHDATARELADWWEEHQAADRAREAKELADAQNAALREQALAKLTPEERDALGL